MALHINKLNIKQRKIHAGRSFVTVEENWVTTLNTSASKWQEHQTTAAFTAT